MNDSIRAAAEALAQCRADENVAKKVLVTATGEHDRIAARIDALTAERATIVGARANGATSPAHGPRLALIAADLEWLENLRGPAVTELANAQAVVDQAGAAAVSAEQHLVHVGDEELLRQVVDHATKLDTVLLATTREIASLSKQLGRSRSPWSPSPQLADTLRRLDLTRIEGPR